MCFASHLTLTYRKYHTLFIQIRHQPTPPVWVIYRCVSHGHCIKRLSHVSSPNVIHFSSNYIFQFCYLLIAVNQWALMWYETWHFPRHQMYNVRRSPVISILIFRLTQKHRSNANINFSRKTANKLTFILTCDRRRWYVSILDGL